MENEGPVLPVPNVSPCYNLSLSDRLGLLEYFSWSRGLKMMDSALTRALVLRCCVQGSVWQGLVSSSSFRGPKGVCVHSILCLANQVWI